MTLRKDASAGKWEEHQQFHAHVAIQHGMPHLCEDKRSDVINISRRRALVQIVRTRIRTQFVPSAQGRERLRKRERERLRGREGGRARRTQTQTHALCLTYSLLISTPFIDTAACSSRTECYAAKRRRRGGGVRDEVLR